MNINILIANTTGGVPPYSYSWREQGPDTALSSATDYYVYDPGTYFVRVTDANGCSEVSNTFTYTATGVEDLSSVMDLSVYPNPFNSETTVDFGQVISKATIRIVDVYGKLVERHEILDTDKYIIKRTKKASGVYFMEVDINKTYFNIKLVIE